MRKGEEFLEGVVIESNASIIETDSFFRSVRKGEDEQLVIIIDPGLQKGIRDFVDPGRIKRSVEFCMGDTRIPFGSVVDDVAFPRKAIEIVDVSRTCYDDCKSLDPSVAHLVLRLPS